MDSHREKCPHESVKCPFIEAGCEGDMPRHQLESHMTSNQQRHLLLVMKDLHRVKSKLSEAEAKHNVTEAKLNEAEAKLVTAVQLLRRGQEIDKETVDFILTCSKRLTNRGDTVEITMPKFSEYYRSGKVWCLSLIHI